jgi:hypothetical protein
VVTGVSAGTSLITYTLPTGCFITATVTVNPTPTVNITNPAAVCSPSTVNLEAAAVTAGSTGGLTYTYWSNPLATISYATPTTAGAGTYYIEGTTGLGCSAVEPVTVTVISNLPVSISITAGANTVCAGTSVTFTATSTNGGATPFYQWEVNGTGVGANSSTYTYTPLDNDLVKCVLTSDAICPTGNPATSNTVTMTIDPVTVGGTATPVSGMVCLNTNTNITAAGYTGAIVHWESNIDGGGWTDIGDAGTVSINTSSIITDGIYEYRAFIQSGTCPSQYSSVATVVTDTINPTISCIGNQTKPTDAGACTYTTIGTEFDPTSTSDNCSVASVKNNINGTASLANHVFPMGITNVIWTVTDESGNTATCSVTVKIIDNINPTITCAGNQTRGTDTYVCSYKAIGTEFDPTSMDDNCSVASIINNIRASLKTHFFSSMPKQKYTIVF